jgi:hypothetical protein
MWQRVTIGLLIGLLPFSVQADDESLKQRWKGLFSEFLAHEKANVCFSLPPDTTAGNVLIRGRGQRALEYFAVASNRTLKMVDGCYVGRPSGRSAQEVTESSTQALLTILKTHGSEIGGGGLLLSAIPAHLRQGVENAFVAIDPSIAESLLANPTNFRVSVGIAPAVEYTNPATGLKGVYARALDMFALADAVRVPVKGSATADTGPLKLSQSRASGPIVFEDRGEVLTVNELLLKLRKEAGLRIAADERLLDSLVVVAGRFTKERVTQVVVELLTAAPPREWTDPRIKTSEQIKSFLEEAGQSLKGAAEKAGYDDGTFPVGKQMPLRNAPLGMSTLPAFLGRLGIGPDSTVRLVRGLTFALGAPGRIPSRTRSYIGEDGQAVEGGRASVSFISIGG